MIIWMVPPGMWLLLAVGTRYPMIATSFLMQTRNGKTAPGASPHHLDRLPLIQSSKGSFDFSWNRTNGSFDQQPKAGPIPVMPSPLFQDLARSQLELLAGSLRSPDSPPGVSKIKTMALYLPQENSQTGQLEFLPAILYPDPSADRVFIANEADSGVATFLPKTLTSLPGFAHAQSLIPTYPILSGGGREARVGVAEEVFCDIRGSRGAALSIPLFSGSQTVGVLLATPNIGTTKNGQSVWTEEDRKQVTRAAQSLSLALIMDTERSLLHMQRKQAAESLSDSLHQIKNPLQALRTYGKLLQRRIADFDGTDLDNSKQLLDLAEHLMVQSDRVINRLRPVEILVDSMESPLRAIGPTSAFDNTRGRWQTPLLPQNDTKAPGAPPSYVSMPPLLPPEVQQQTSATDSIAHQQDSMKIEMTFIEDTLEAVFSGFKGIASDTGMSFEVKVTDELPGIFTCPEAVQEIVTNVLDNAFKYVKPFRGQDGSVLVTMEPSQGSGRGVSIRIEDNGPGIDPQDQLRIFKRGYRGNNSETADGTGLGLHIAFNLVKKLGGTISVGTSSTLKGAEFNINIHNSNRK